MKRYQNIVRGVSETGKRFISNPVYPEIPPTEDDIYIITTAGDRYDTLALQFYKDSTLWWAIASSNNSNRSSILVEPGVQLRIPADKNRVIELFEQVNKFR